MQQAHIIQRIRGEFLEMPGLRLTAAQAERLCGLDRTLCEAVLEALVDSKFLAVTSAGMYMRATEGTSRPATVARQNRALQIS